MADQPLLSYAVNEPTEDELQLRVSDYIDDNGGWKWATFTDKLQREILQHIASIPVMKHGEIEDSLVWDSSKDGEYTMRDSFLNLIKGEET